MGKPENIDDFHKLSLIGEPDIEIYVLNAVLDKHIKNGELLMVIEGFGIFTIKIINH